MAPLCQGCVRRLPLKRRRDRGRHVSQGSGWSHPVHRPPPSPYGLSRGAKERRVKTEYNRARNCWGAMLIAASLLGACGQVEEGPGQEEVAVEEQALTGVVLGM